MQSKAKKFTFELMNDEELNISSEGLGVLKFHGVAAETEASEKDLVENHSEKTLVETLKEEALAEQTMAKNIVELKIVKEKVAEQVTVTEVPVKLELNPVDDSKKAKKKKFKNSNYFGVKNHLDLFEIGKHYTDAFHSGMKSLAFHGDQKKSVHHTILGLASFFNYHKGVKATVFVEKFEGSELSKFLKPTHVEMEMVSGQNEEDSYEVFSCDGVDIVEMHKLKHLAFKMGMDTFNEFLAGVVNASEIIFWDLPEAASINKEREFYLPILNVVNSLSLVVDTGASKIKKVKEMSVFAGKYQVSVEGVLMYKNFKRS